MRRGLAALAAAFVAGAAGMAVEILSSRRLAHGFGATLSTWSFLIAATLLAGAVGALVGARASRNPSPRRLAVALLVGAVATGLDAVLGATLVRALEPLPLDVGAAIGALALVGPPVVAFSSVVPLAIADVVNLGQTQLHRIGPIAGLVLCASTLGSLVGTLGAALLLLPAIGLAASTFAIAGAVALTALVIGGGRTSSATGLAVLAAIGVAAVLSTREGSGSEGVLVARESAYGRVTIERRPAGVALLVDGVAQGTRSPFDAGLEALLKRGQHVAALPMLHPMATRALVVGLGSGVVTQAFSDRGLDVTTIDVNPVLVDVVRERWGIPGTVVVGDGRASLRRLTGVFDLAVLDAFQGEGLPSHLVTREAFEELRAHLSPGAIACVHLVGAPWHRVTGAVAATLRVVFPFTLALRSRSGAAVEDLFLLASDKPLSLPPDPDFDRARTSTFLPPPGDVLTDDWNPIDRWNEPLARLLRESSR
jgi:spermidine synthase